MTHLVDALGKAQAEMKNAVFNKVNPHFKSKYADLASIRDAVLPALTKHGICVTQTTDLVDAGLVLRTTLRKGDDTIESVYPLPIDKPQVMGSAISYARRYTLAAICAISSDEDDDANAAQEGASPRKPAAKKNGLGKPEPEPLDDATHEETRARCTAKINECENLGEMFDLWRDDGFQTDLKALQPDAYQRIIELKDSRKAALNKAEREAKK